MTTYNTMNPLGSSAPQDLYDNAENFDHLSNDLKNEKWKDRLGRDRKTWYGIEKQSDQAMLNYGYITKKSFEVGATLDTPNTVLQWESDGEFYRWDGDWSQPKVVPPGSTPDTTGGIGPGKWVGVGDASLRGELEKYKYRTDYTSIYFVPGVNFDTSVDNRDVIYGFSGVIYVPDGVVIRCNFLPTDDVRKINGKGTVLTRDQWGNEHSFNLNFSTSGYPYTPSQIIDANSLQSLGVTIGCIGDSITDGVNTDGWVANPVSDSGENNLSSTNYDHTLNGGSNCWFTNMQNILNLCHFGRSGWSSRKIRCFNAASNGKRLTSGWGYRNFEYGFFQNDAYENKAPDILLIALGENDIYDRPTLQDYSEMWDQIIRKAWGYGCAVGLVSVTNINTDRAELEGQFKRYVERNYPSVQFFDMSEIVYDAYTNPGMGGDAVDGFYRTSGFDKIHPAQLAHDKMGAYMARLLSPKRFITAKKNTKYLAIDDSKTYFEGSSGTRYEVTMDNLSYSGGAAGTNALVNLLKGWTLRRVTEPVYIRYLVWNDSDADIDVSVFYPLRSVHFSGSDRSMDTAIMMNRYDSNHGLNHVYLRTQQDLQPPAGNSYSPRVSHLATLRRGLNIIQVIEQTQPDHVVVPMLIFSDKHKGFSSGTINIPITIAANSELLPDGFSTPETHPLKVSYQADNIGAYSPDLVNGVTGRFSQSITMNSAGGISNLMIRVCYNPLTGKRVQIAFTGSAGNYKIAFESRDEFGSVVASDSQSITDAARAYLDGGGDFTVIARSIDVTVIFDDFSGKPIVKSTAVNGSGGIVVVRNQSTTTSIPCSIKSFSLNVFANSPY